MRTSLVAIALGAGLAACSSNAASPGPAGGTTSTGDSGTPPASNAPDGGSTTAPSELDVSLVHDVNTKLASTMPLGFVARGSETVFGARGTNGWSLFATNGTKAGIHVLTALPPGTTNAMPLATMNGRVFFSAQTAAAGIEMWVTDANGGAPALLVDACPGPVSSVPHYAGTIANTLFFSANVGGANLLFATDGTTAGTKQLSITSISDVEVVVLGSKLLFASGPATPEGDGQELWISDGTHDGTRLLKDIQPGPTGSMPVITGTLGGTVLFFADDGTHGSELWKTDGTAAGTTMVMDINPGAAGSSLGFGISNRGATLGSFVYFMAQTAANGYELWRSDGTAAGTTLVKDIAAGAASSYPTGLVPSANRLFFSANDGVHGNEPWSSDGTAAGTVLVEDTIAGANGSVPGDFAALPGGGAMFVADDGVHGREPWRTDGTAAGTVVIDSVPGAAPSNPDLTTTPNGVFLSAATASSAGLAFFEPSASATPTVLNDDLETATSDGSIRNLVADGARVFFEADDGTGSQLWVSDGTDAGTKKLTSGIDPVIHGGAFGPIVIVNHVAFFSGWDAAHDVELWKSDGTLAGTEMVKDIDAAGASVTGIVGAALGSELLFCANDGTHGIEMWKSDGTAAGTTMIADENPGTGTGCGSTPTPVVVDGAVYYQGNDQQWGSIFRADTTKITRLGPVGLYPTRFFPTNDGLYFQGSQALGGPPVQAGVWKSDGTLAGTTFVLNAVAVAATSFGATTIFSEIDQIGTWNGSSISPYASVGVLGSFGTVTKGGALFVGGNTTDGFGAWWTDGTEAGTAPLTALTPTVLPPTFATIADRTYFPGETTEYGAEVWSTDGTKAGTHIAADVSPGVAGSTPSELVSFGDSILFVADDGRHGAELMIAKKRPQ